MKDIYGKQKTRKSIFASQAPTPGEKNKETKARRQSQHANGSMMDGQDGSDSEYHSGDDDEQEEDNDDQGDDESEDLSISLQDSELGYVGRPRNKS